MAKPPKFARSRAVEALPPYFGGKRKLAPMIGRYLREAGYGPERGLPLLDGFTGGGSTALYFKLLGYETHTNDISFRSSLLGKALIQNSRRHFTDGDLARLMAFQVPEPGIVVTKYVPVWFPPNHAAMIDRLVQFAYRQPEEALQAVTLLIAWKYLISLRPMSQFTSTQAFTIPFNEGRFDDIRQQYDGTLKNALKTPKALLRTMIDSVNQAIRPNARANSANRGDALEFLLKPQPSIVYVDPPYPNTLGYTAEYHPVDEILTNSELPKEESGFSGPDAWAFIDSLMAASAHHPCLLVSLGSAGGKNQLHELTDLIRKHRPDDHYRFDAIKYAHREGNATAEFTDKNEEWICMAWRPA